jgi:catechol 2,3-dioxygenase-like lactoylglutathione lyase family enzyme
VERSSLPQYDKRRFQVGFDVANIDSAREALIAAGAEPIPEIEGGDNRWAYFRDPEGNVFEITQRRARPSKPG